MEEPSRSGAILSGASRAAAWPCLSGVGKRRCVMEEKSGRVMTAKEQEVHL